MLVVGYMMDEERAIYPAELRVQSMTEVAPVVLWEVALGYSDDAVLLRGCTQHDVVLAVL